MIRSYLKIALRNIRLYKTYSSINIIGLTVGLATFFIMLLYVLYQISFDKYNKKIDDIYLLTSEIKIFNNSTAFCPLTLAAKLKEKYPEIENFARYSNEKTVIKYQDRVFEEKRCAFTDPGIFDILTLPAKLGKYPTAPDGDKWIVITESMAEKYFGSVEPCGKVLNLKCGKNEYDLTIIAVLKDIPETSTFSADFIVPITINPDFNAFLSPRMYPRFLTYVLLSHSADINGLNQKLGGFSDYSLIALDLKFHLFPVKDIYFHQGTMVDNIHFRHGNLSNVYIYSIAAILIFAISLITFLMLNIGRTSLRIKEIGIRKIIGALKRDLFYQIMIESLLITFMALLPAVILVQILLPQFTQLIGIKIYSEYFHSWMFVLLFVFVAVIVGTISGLYVWAYIFKLHPADILRRRNSSGSNKIYFRRILIAVPIIIFSGLIFSSITIFKQLLYFHDKDFGFNKEQLVFFTPDYERFNNDYYAFKNLLKSNPNIINISAGAILPGENSYSMIVDSAPGTASQVVSEILLADEDFIETLQIKMLSGQTFREFGVSDSSKVCIINESALKAMNLKSPLGQELYGYRIIGVTKDFIVHSLHTVVKPAIIRYNAKSISNIVIRIQPDNIINTIKYISENSKQYNNGKPMSFSFLDDRLDAMYCQETRFAEVFGIFTGLAISVACLGIFGMSLFLIQNRVKEIGIRKVLGASVKSLIALTLKDLLLTSVISTIITFPVAYYLINKWLQNFAYRISFDVWIFLLTTLFVMVIVIMTIGIQATRAALMNPVKSIRYE